MKTLHSKIGIIRNTFILLLLSLSFAVVYPQASRDEYKSTYTAAFYKNPFDDVNPNDATTAYNVWIKELMKNVNADFLIKVKLYDSFEELTQKLEKDKIALSILSTVDYLTYADKNNFKPMFASLIDNKPGSSYLIITRKDKQFNSISDLKNSSIGITTSYLHKAAAIWLEVLLFNNNLPNKDKFFSRTVESTKDSKVVLDVFFGKLDACLIPESAYAVMTELNPQIKAQLKILDQSPFYMNLVLCFTNNLKDKNIYETIKNKIINVTTSSSGKQMLTIMKINSIVPFNEEYLESTKKLLSTYTDLKKKH